MLFQTHTEANEVNYRSDFFITINMLSDFGHHRDQDAIYHRMKVLVTKVLLRKDTSVTSKSIHPLL